MGRVHVVSFIAVLALVLPPPALAQQGTAQISGRVSDDQGAALPGVTIVVTYELSSGISRESHLLEVGVVRDG